MPPLPTSGLYEAEEPADLLAFGAQVQVYVSDVLETLEREEKRCSSSALHSRCDRSSGRSLSGMCVASTRTSSAKGAKIGTSAGWCHRLSCVLRSSNFSKARGIVSGAT